jgi:Protein of unknown function (DUF3627)/MSV199 domain
MKVIRIEDIESREYYCELALVRSVINIPPITKYIDETKFPVDDYNYLCYNLIEWCGYKGEIKTMKLGFIKLLKKNNIPYIELGNDKVWDYYVIRAQKNSATRAYKSRLEVVIDIEYQPNAINLFNHIKESLRNERKVVRITGNYIKLLKNYSHENFHEDVKQIDNEKKDV